MFLLLCTLQLPFQLFFETGRPLLSSYHPIPLYSPEPTWTPAQLHTIQCVGHKKPRPSIARLRHGWYLGSCALQRQTAPASCSEAAPFRELPDSLRSGRAPAIPLTAALADATAAAAAAAGPVVAAAAAACPPLGERGDAASVLRRCRLVGASPRACSCSAGPTAYESVRDSRSALDCRSRRPPRQCSSMFCNNFS
eukprot:SAG22_NODE_1987_length_3201_cov_12.979046_2_plen_196_part_00